MGASAPSWHRHLLATPGAWPRGALAWTPLKGLQVWLCPAHSEPSAGTWAAPILANSFCRPWTQSRPKSKGGLFLKQRPEGATQKALCFGVAALKGLLSLNILLQERSPNPDIPETRVPGGFKGAICLVSVPPRFCPVSLRHLSLGSEEGPHPPSLTGGFLSTRASPRVSGHGRAPVPGEGLSTSSQGGRPLVLHP